MKDFSDKQLNSSLVLYPPHIYLGKFSTENDRVCHETYDSCGISILWLLLFFLVEEILFFDSKHTQMHINGLVKS